MTRRLVAVAAPAEVSPLALAMLEDVVDLVASMQEVEAALAVADGAGAEVTAVTWPGMPVVAGVPGVARVLEELQRRGADEGAVVCPDAPDLPVLLLGKLHSALTGAQVAVCPAEPSGLVAVAARLPAPGWLSEALSTLDDADALTRLRAAAPPRSLVVGPGWHRMRSEDDLARLDPQLEGWEATRALLGR